MPANDEQLLAYQLLHEGEDRLPPEVQQSFIDHRAENGNEEDYADLFEPESGHRRRVSEDDDEGEEPTWVDNEEDSDEPASRLPRETKRAKTEGYSHLDDFTRIMFAPMPAEESESTPAAATESRAPA